MLIAQALLDAWSPVSKGKTKIPGKCSTIDQTEPILSGVSQTPILITDRLILRRWRDSDRELFARMNADPRVMEFFADRLSRDRSDALVDRAECHFREHGFGPCAAEFRADGTFIGFIGLSIPSFQIHGTSCVEIGWRLAADYWGQGLATEGARATLRYGFEILGLEEIVSFTVPANTRSRRVMEKLGMRHNPADDFDHPLLPVGHPLERHLLYRLRRRAGSFGVTEERK